MQLSLDLVDLLSAQPNRRSLNEDFRRAGSDLRVIHLSPEQLETFDSFGTDIPLEIDADGFVGVKPLNREPGSHP